ncbi:nucleotidyltransferase domain-containing protein [Nitrogeniibacter aestuarii]|uniref:nucleotidyltransferase domain-containing protein n=1 Tax=Nitrogeniibacter aestuarii TaxID=2815343 RepID=UPI001D0FC208|nr:nucleotidyltransferase domain-containing protein [Nitrogeniibacter aestuarii]
MNSTWARWAPEPMHCAALVVVTVADPALLAEINALLAVKTAAGESKALDAFLDRSVTTDWKSEHRA